MSWMYVYISILQLVFRLFLYFYIYLCVFLSFFILQSIELSLVFVSNVINVV